MKAAPAARACLAGHRGAGSQETESAANICVKGHQCRQSTGGSLMLLLLDAWSADRRCVMRPLMCRGLLTLLVECTLWAQLTGAVCCLSACPRCSTSPICPVLRCLCVRCQRSYCGASHLQVRHHCPVFRVLCQQCHVHSWHDPSTTNSATGSPDPASPTILSHQVSNLMHTLTARIYKCHPVGVTA